MSPGGSGPLADLFIQFSQRGIEAVNAAIDTATKAAAGFATAATTAGQTAQTAFQKAAGLIGSAAGQIGSALKALPSALEPFEKKLAQVQAGLSGLAQVAKSALTVASASVMGFVTAGVSMSVLGTRLTYDMERLSLSIAGLFAPTIQRITEMVERFTGWLNSLSEAQRANMSHWLSLGIAAAGFLAFLPKITAAVSALKVAFSTLAPAISAALASTGIGAILPIVGALVAAGGAVVYLTQGWEGLQSIFKAFAPVVDAIKSALASMAPVFEQIGEVVAQVVQDFLPLVEVFAELAATMVEAFAPVTRAILQMIAALLKAMAPIIGLFAKFATIIAKIVVPVLTLLAKIIGWLAQGIAFLVDGLNKLLDLAFGKGERASRSKPTGHGPLLPKTGGFESIEATWTRIAQASVKIGGFGKKPEERAAESLERLEGKVDRIASDVANPRPEVGR